MNNEFKHNLNAFKTSIGIHIVSNGHSIRTRIENLVKKIIFLNHNKLKQDLKRY